MHRIESGKFTQSTTVYNVDGTGEQDGQQGRHSEKDNKCRRSELERDMD